MTTKEKNKLDQVKELALTLMRKHDLPADGWQFNYNHAKRIIGLCHHTEKKIELSKWYALGLSKKEIKDTILHEIAHALCPPSQEKKGNGRRVEPPHGEQWKAMCRKIGATPQARKKIENDEWLAIQKKVTHIYQRDKKPLEYNYPEFQRYRMPR